MSPDLKAVIDAAMATIREALMTEVVERPVSTTEAAKMLGYADPGALRRMRSMGKGPRYERSGGRCVYRLADLEEWAKANPRTPRTPRRGGQR